MSNNGEGVTYSIPGVFNNGRMTYSQLHIALHRLVRVRDVWKLHYEINSKEGIKKRIECWDEQIAIVENFIAEARQKRQQEADVLTIKLLTN